MVEVAQSETRMYLSNPTTKRGNQTCIMMTVGNTHIAYIT